MPPVRSVSCTADLVELVDFRGAKRLLRTDIPQNQNTPAKVEAFANAWAVMNITDYQVRIHVFSLAPMQWTVGTWNLGELVSDNWWQG